MVRRRRESGVILGGVNDGKRGLDMYTNTVMWDDNEVYVLCGFGFLIYTYGLRNVR